MKALWRGVAGLRLVWKIVLVLVRGAFKAIKSIRLLVPKAWRERELPAAFLLYAYVVICSATLLYGLASTQGPHINLATDEVTHSLKMSALDENQPTAKKPALRPEKPGAVECSASAFGPGRELRVDAKGGGEYGLVQFRNTLPLAEKEVVFTFDDGPHPTRTLQILDTLDRYCVKAVFFLIGEMAQHHPELVREIERRGHVIGAHTLSHPVSLTFLSEARARDQIEQGFAAVSEALGGPTAPFFRFPGLGQSKRLLDYLAERNIAVWSVDVVSGNSEGASAQRLPRLMMSRLETRGRGILLFHDIKASTVESLATIIETLREEGYRPVRVVPGEMFIPDREMIAKLQERRQQAFLRHGRAKIR